MNRLDNKRNGSDELNPPSKRAREGEGSSDGGRNVTSFFDFVKHRSSFVFKKDEVWAVRDEYGMPRRYVVIENDGDIHSTSVIYLKYDTKVPSQVCDYNYYGARQAYGMFVADTDPEPLDRPAFSFKVVGWEMKKRSNNYAIYPKKGEVWARIKYDTHKLGFLGPTLLIYEMVEVLEDYDSTGVKIVPLVRVKGGYRTLFRRNTYKGIATCSYLNIHQSFNMKCAYQVPCFRVSGESAIDGCLELDPSSLPLYIEDFGSGFDPGLNPQLTDNCLFLGLLDKMVLVNRFVNTHIWAVYDKENVVPLKYVAVKSKEVNSKTKLVMHELVPSPINVKAKKWHEAGLPMACGNFMITPIETKKQFVLSHQVAVTFKDDSTACREYCTIYPHEGEVWGVYKDQNTGMSCNPEGTLEYQIVVIVGKLSIGVKVAYLVRVEGFKGLFRIKSGPASEVRTDEFYRFSHRIPSHRFGDDVWRKYPHRFGEVRRKLIVRGTFVLDPHLVPIKDGECFSFTDHFLLEGSKAHPCWLAILYIIDKERNGISLDSQDISSQKSENCVINSTKEREGVVVENTGEGESSLYEISPVSVNRDENSEPEAVEEVTVHRHPKVKFHDFDNPGSENDFELGQLWALYNEADGLPRSYARIDKFVTSGITMEVTLLEPHPLADEEMQWVEENLPMTCGTFRASRSTHIIERINFAHRVICDDRKPSRLFYKVFPRKGEVWAIYRHWDLGWTHSDMKNNVQYKLVEVVSDFTEEAGVTVVALVRAEGHEDVFRRQLHEGFWLFMTYKRKDLLRFSHCIPSLKMMGDQDGSTPEGLIKIKFSHDGI